MSSTERSDPPSPVATISSRRIPCAASAVPSTTRSARSATRISTAGWPTGRRGRGRRDPPSAGGLEQQDENHDRDHGNEDRDHPSGRLPSLRTAFSGPCGCHLDTPRWAGVSESVSPLRAEFHGHGSPSCTPLPREMGGAAEGRLRASPGELALIDEGDEQAARLGRGELGGHLLETADERDELLGRVVGLGFRRIRRARSTAGRAIERLGERDGTRRGPDG